MDKNYMMRPLVFLLGLIQVSSVRADSSFMEYAQGRFSKALESVRSELSGEIADSSAFMTRVRIATHSFAQDPTIPFKDLLLTYEVAAGSADRYGYSERLRDEQAAMAEWFGKEGLPKPEDVLISLKKAIALPRGDVDQIRKRSAQLFAIGCLARRRSLVGDRDAEWLFVAARALEADTKSGYDFFVAYLESHQAKRLRHHKEAKTEVERIRREQGIDP